MESESLSKVFEGWDGYQTSLVHAIAPLTSEQLAFRPAPKMRSAGEIAIHIALGRIDWFSKMGAPGSAELLARQAGVDRNGPITTNATDLARWLEDSWGMIAETLAQWTVDDLQKTYRHEYWGNVYAVSRQWTIWRILTHDVQHGGQLTVLLEMQGIEAPELSALGGHLTEPPKA
jgi:uncharacterized damage-inducible protein DinB